MRSVIFKLYHSVKKLVQAQPKRHYFCHEPWTGVLDIRTNSDVVFCPCHLKMKIGNLERSTMQEIWNSKQLMAFRKSFEKGKLPKACRGQHCPVVLGEGHILKER